MKLKANKAGTSFTLTLTKEDHKTLVSMVASAMLAHEDLAKQWAIAYHKEHAGRADRFLDVLMFIRPDMDTPRRVFNADRTE